MDLELRPAAVDDLAWIERAVATCPETMAELGGFYGRARAKLAPLMGEGREVLVISRGDRRVGFIDADRDEAGSWHLTYFVVPADRRSGVAQQALQILGDRKRPEPLVAAISRTNLASLATARRAGFVDVGVNEWGEIIWRRQPVAAEASSG